MKHLKLTDLVPGEFYVEHIVDRDDDVAMRNWDGCIMLCIAPGRAHGVVHRDGRQTNCGFLDARTGGLSLRWATFTPLGGGEAEYVSDR